MEMNNYWRATIVRCIGFDKTGDVEFMEVGGSTNANNRHHYEREGIKWQ